MPYSNNEVLYRQIITDHYQYPKNKGLVEEPDYIYVHLKNPSCGDDLTLQVKIENDVITDVRFEGSGCAICCASSSMMTERVKGQPIEEALRFIHQFSNMLIGEAYDEESLGEAIALQGVAKLPPRIKCATLSHKALERAITDKKIEDLDLEEVQEK